MTTWPIVYISDILIYSSNLKEHIEHVKKILKRVSNNGLHAKAEKCEFHKQRVSFLGYILDKDGVGMDDSEVKAILNWPQPINV